MRVEVLTSPGCPNAAVAKETVIDCLAALGIDTPIIDRVGPYPSPTILIDGIDVMRPDGGAPTGNSCRLDLPTTPKVLDALRSNTSDNNGACL